MGMPFLSHGGISLRYERAGGGLPLVLIHGLMANHTFWDRQLPLRRQFQVIRMDLRGHGDSSKPRGAYGMTTFATDVQHLVSALGLQRCVLVGWSMGGVVAQEALHLLGAKVVGLVLVNTTPCAAAANGFPHGMTPDEQQKHLTLAETDYKGFARDLGARCFRQESTALVQWATQQMLRTPPYVTMTALQALFATDERQALASITVPTLICHGDHDTVFPPEAGQYLHEHIRGSRLVTFANSAHAVMIEETEAFNAELGAFLEALGDPTPATTAAPEAQPAAASSAATPTPKGAAPTTRPTQKVAPRSRTATPAPSPGKQEARTGHVGKKPTAASSRKTSAEAGPKKKKTSPAASAGTKPTAKRPAAKPTAQRPSTKKR